MSEFQSDDFKQTRKVVIKTQVKEKGKGAGAFVVSLLFFVPLLPIVGMYLGLAARRANAALPGDVRSPLATCAVALGVLFTIGQAFVGFRTFEYHQQVSAGPARALNAGFNGKAPAFAGAFTAESAGTAEQAKAFIQKLQSRYGKFTEARLVGSVAASGPGEPRRSPRPILRRPRRFRSRPRTGPRTDLSGSRKPCGRSHPCRGPTHPSAPSA